MSIIKKVFFKLRNLELLSWVPDKAYLSIYYRFVNGCWPDLSNPKLFTEKLQWLKIHDHKPVYSVMADKYRVKEYVSDRIGKEYVIPLLGVWDDPKMIPFEKLPNRFVLKTTHDSGGVVVVDKSKGYEQKEIENFLNAHLRKNLYKRTREWPYKNIPHQIIAEEYLENDVLSVNGVLKSVLLDYKFYCFNGEPKFLYVGFSNMDNGMKHDLLSFFDLNWQKPEFYRSDHEPIPFDVKKPDKLDEMIELCKCLAKDIPFVRVDLYYVDNKIYFSELTFSPGSGFARFKPEEWERRLGDWICLPNLTRCAK